MDSSLKITDEQSAAVQKTEHRVSLESIEKKVASCEYINPKDCPQFTIAVVRLSNGYIVLGESAPADPESFNADLGRQFAYENAIRKIWPMEGYLLREKLSSPAA